MKHFDNLYCMESDLSIAIVLNWNLTTQNQNDLFITLLLVLRTSIELKYSCIV